MRPDSRRTIRIIEHLRRALLACGLLACVLLGVAAPSHQVHAQDQSIHAGVCRNGPGCDSAQQDPNSCDGSFIDCYGDLLQAVLFALAAAALFALLWEIAAPAAVLTAVSEVTETTVAAVEATELTAAEATAAEATVAEATTAEDAMVAERAAAESRLESLAGKAGSGGGTENCSWMAREVDQGLGDMFAGGTPQPYAPAGYTPEFAPDAVVRGEMPGLADLSTMEAEYGSSFNATSMQGIVSELEASGNGSRGIVWVNDIWGGSHVFNAVNYGGEVFFVDGQAAGLGQTAVWTDTSYMSGYGPVDTWVHFMLTAGG